ncbi:MAG: permease-like cell division protein FtsX [Bacteroidetes bacterium]|nr:permease-like cell division protein FtsX [Bacteroidota bacterium]
MAIKRRKPSVWPSVLSLSSVMFMLGLLAFSLFGFKGLSEHLMESSSIDIYFTDGTTQSQVLQIEKNILKEPWVKKTQFISPADGVKEMRDKYDPEFLSYAESISLPLSLEIYPKAEYANIIFIDRESKNLRTRPRVEDVIYQRNWVENMTTNVQRLQIIFAIASIISLFIAITLIQSSTRLSIFANRFLIKSMQLVGATNSFIVWPYVVNFIRYSLFAIPIALGSLLMIFYGLPYLFHEFAIIADFTQYITTSQLLLICVSVASFGVILSVISSWLSTQHYLRSKIENLY